jgi:hypothetical protein
LPATVAYSYPINRLTGLARLCLGMVVLATGSVLPVSAASRSGPASAPATPTIGGPSDISANASRPIIVPPSASALPRDILKQFNFDERKLGNVEDLPMYWLQRTGPKLPHYNSGAFDWTVGHDAPPSFRLNATTESVAFTYFGNDIPVEPGSRYMVSGWIRTENLRRSRAYISAVYLARDMQVIDQTEFTSPAIGGPEQNGQWHHVALPTSESPRAARFLQLTVWLAQPDLHQAPLQPARPIAEQDTHGVAWFDDIEVTHLLPVASIRMRDDIPVSLSSGPAQLLGPQVNPAHFGLSCRIRVTDEDGKVHYYTQTDPRELGTAPPTTIQLNDLPSGLYTATLQVLSQTRQVTEQEVRFARLPALPDAINSQIGVCLDESSLRAPEATMACLRGMQARYVKIPVWIRGMTDNEIAQGQVGAEDLLKRVLAGGLEPIGVFVAPPGRIGAGLLSAQPSLADVFTADRQVWQPHMALSLTHYADVMRLWQIGQDGQVDPALDSRFAAGASAAAQQITTLIDGTQVAMAWPATLGESGLPPYIRRESLSLPNAVRPEQICQYLEQHTHPGHPLWVTVWPIEGTRYSPAVRRTDIAKRIVFTLAGEAETIFVPQPWQVLEVGDQAILAPTVEYTVLATLSRSLADRRYGGSFQWANGATFHIFANQEDAVLVAWNDQVRDATQPEAKVSLSLGPTIAAIDLRGRNVHVDNGQVQTVTLGREPILISGVDARLAKLRSQFRIEPRQIASGLRKHQETVTLLNPYSESMNGTIRLRGPEGWEIRPSRVAFSLQPGQTLQAKVEIRIPYNEPVGPKTIQADLSIDARRMSQLTIPAILDLELPGIETYAFADTTGQEVVIRHVLTNRTLEELSFVGSVMLPKMTRQERLFLHVRPGQTLIKEYVIPRDQITGQPQLRLSLREINGARLLNQTVEIF